MARVFDPSTANAAIRAFLLPRGVTLYMPAGRPDILLKKIGQGDSYFQFGGAVKIQLNLSGSVRLIGTAGRCNLLFDTIKGTMNITHQAITRMVGPLTQRSAHAGMVEDFALKEVFSSDVVFGDKNGGLWNDDQIAEELVMGWICPTEMGFIWSGTVRLDAPYNYFSTEVVKPSLAVLARIPYDIDWTKIDLAHYKTVYLAQADEEVRGMVSGVWDEEFKKVTGAPTRVYQPCGAFVYGTGMEFGHCRMQTCYPSSSTGGSYSIFADVKYGGEYVGISLRVAGTAFPMLGSSRHGLIWPRLVGVGKIASDEMAYISRTYDPPEFAAATGWPLTIDALPAQGVFGHLFPGVYADGSGIFPTTNVSTAGIMSPLNYESLNPGQVVKVSSTGGSDPGDAYTTGAGSLAEMVMNTDTLGGGADHFIKAIYSQIASITEAKVRATRPF